jgi:hypothetical protein
MRRQRTTPSTAGSGPAHTSAPSSAFCVVTMDPVPKRLALHPAGLGRRLAVGTLQNQRDRQHPPRRLRIMASGCASTKIARCKLPQCDRNHHPNLHPLMEVNHNLQHVGTPKRVRHIACWYKMCAAKVNGAGPAIAWFTASPPQAGARSQRVARLVGVQRRRVGPRAVPCPSADPTRREGCAPPNRARPRAARQGGAREGEGMVVHAPFVGPSRGDWQG